MRTWETLIACPLHIPGLGIGVQTPTLGMFPGRKLNPQPFCYGMKLQLREISQSHPLLLLILKSQAFSLWIFRVPMPRKKGIQSSYPLFSWSFYLASFVVALSAQLGPPIIMGSVCRKQDLERRQKHLLLTQIIFFQVKYLLLGQLWYFPGERMDWI